MRLLARNKVKFYYCLYQGNQLILNEDGSSCGEYKLVYSDPQRALGNISSAQGQAQVEQFGSNLNYDKVIVYEDPNCPIDENTVLFIDKEPEFDEDGNPMFDYVVTRVAKSLNSVSYAVSKVKVG